MEGPRDYQLHYLEQDAWIDRFENFQRHADRDPATRVPRTKEARAENNLFHFRKDHELGRQLDGYEQRERDGTLRLRSEVTPIPKQLVTRLMKNDHAGVKLFVKQDPPGHPEGRTAEARADVDVANDACKFIINDTESCYLSY